MSPEDFRAIAGKHPGPEAVRLSWLDLAIYRLFYWRWAPILRRRPDLVEMIRRHITAWQAASDPSPSPQPETQPDA